MSIRQEMLRAASSAPNRLHEAGDRVLAFVRSRFNPDGGFAGRSADSDLYYTVFAVESLLALGGELPADALAGYLRGFGDGAELDLVHLACLARCWADLAGGDEATRDGIGRRLDALRCGDGAFHHTGRGRSGSVYGCFLVLGAFEDLARPMDRPDALADCVESLAAGDGGYANDRHLSVGSTAATAAAVTALRRLGRPIDPASAEWLLARRNPDGGFGAASVMCSSDLLSTATALHALAAAGERLADISEPCLDFLDSLWSPKGAFRACQADPVLDCEYTFYGLLALGHLKGS